MKKLIIAILMLCSLNTHAGFSLGAAKENYEYIKQSTGRCTITIIDGVETERHCSGYVDKRRTSALRLSLGYDLPLASKYGLEARLGVNTLSNGSLELNGTHQTTDKIKVKAGLNASKDLGHTVVKDVKPGIGYQVGAEYKLNKTLDLVGSVGTKAQSYKIINEPSVQNDSSISGQLGIKWTF